MIRYINEKEVAQILTMEKTVELVEQALRDRAEGRAIDTPRVRTAIPAGSLQIMQGAVPGMNLIGYKAYYSARSKGTRYFVHLFDADNAQAYRDHRSEPSRHGAHRRGKRRRRALSRAQEFRDRRHDRRR